MNSGGYGREVPDETDENGTDLLFGVDAGRLSLGHVGLPRAGVGERIVSAF